MVFAIAALVFTSGAVEPLPRAAANAAAKVAASAPAAVPDASARPIPSAANSEISKTDTGVEKPVGLSMANSEALALVTVPPIQSGKQPELISAERAPSRRSWLMLAIAEHSAAALDAYSTRMAIGTGAYERDPLMKPFANSPAIYGALQVAPVLFDLAGRKMQRSDNLFLRRVWWIPQMASTGSSILAGIHNIRIANRSK